MTLLELKRFISDMIANDPNKCDCNVRILTQTNVQVEQDLADIAYSSRQNRIILLPEGFDPE